MYPWIIDWTVNGFNLRVPSYGVFLAIAFLTGYYLALKKAVKLKIDPVHIENLFILCIFSALLGSRIFHVVFEELSYYSKHPVKIFMVWEGGYTFYGALLGCLLSVYLYCKIKKISYLDIMDILSPSCTLGLGIGRVGCFLAGCCWGKKTDMPWGVRFSNPESFTLDHVNYLHPSQLYEAFGSWLIFLFVSWRFQKRHYKGQIFFESLALYSILRFLVEYFRGDEYRGYVFHGLMSNSQFVSIMILPFALLGMVIYANKSLKKKK
jgi:phosphatidylglycerol:prolipoprotein diacylglycerol transferase